jgi:hypothetical protein
MCVPLRKTAVTDYALSDSTVGQRRVMKQLAVMLHLACLPW